jgi:hypothetical protein
VIQEGVLADGNAEEGAPLSVYAGVKRELDRDVPLDGVQADGLGMQRDQIERPRARPVGGGGVILALAASESIRSLRALAASLLDRDMEAGMAARR